MESTISHHRILALLAVVAISAALAACTGGTIDGIVVGADDGGAPPPPERRFDQVTWLTSHNAFANKDDSPLIVPNQAQGLRAQLDAGVRAFMLDIHYWEPPALLCVITLGQNCPPPGVYLCHGECESLPNVAQALTPKPLSGALETVRGFLVEHPDEVVTVFLEDYVSADQLRDVITQVGGLAELVFDPEAPEWSVHARGWPTVAAMIAADKRLVLFTDNAGNDNVAGVQHDAQYTVQNYWSIGNGDAYECVSRWSDIPLDQTETGWDRLFVMSHFRDIPFADNAALDNTYDNLARRVDEYCAPAAGKAPHFVAVDFCETPDRTAADYVAHLNEAR